MLRLISCKNSHFKKSSWTSHCTKSRLSLFKTRNKFSFNICQILIPQILWIFSLRFEESWHFLFVRFSSKTAFLDCKVKDRTKTNNICEELFSMSSYIFHSSRNSIPNISFLSMGPNMRFFDISRGCFFWRWSTEVRWGTDMWLVVNGIHIQKTSIRAKTLVYIEAYWSHRQ